MINYNNEIRPQAPIIHVTMNHFEINKIGPQNHMANIEWQYYK
jgi:hypothetical protein